MGAKNLGLAASSEAERATNALAQTAHDALVATETAAIADVAVKAPLKIAADAAVVTAGAVDAKVAAVDLFATNDGEKAAAIRDGMNAGLPRVANGMDGQAILARAAASNLSNAGEKSAALVKVTALDDAITAFKGSTTNNTALDTYGTVTTAMATVKAATVTASGGGSTMSGIASVAALTSAYAHVKVIAPAYSDVKPAAVTAAAAASTALVNSEAAAATATAAKNASQNPANLKGQGLSVADGANARTSITTIDKAIQTVNIQRSELGAVSNRLNHTVNNLTNISSNLSAAKGGIEDADFALETTNLAKNQILQQASTAMLAQANASKQNVQSLLQG